MASIFNPDETSRLFGLPLGVDFSTAFLDGLFARLGDAMPEEIARVEIFTNTRRAARRWEELLQSRGAMLLPRIRVITDLAAVPLHGPVPQSSGLAQHLILMQAVRKLLASGVSLAPVSASFDLAGTLARLMDELDGEGVPRDAISKLDMSDYSEHWQTALAFLRLIQDASLTGAPALGSDARLRLAVTAVSEVWAAAPPKHPIIIAGSTGSRGTTASLMQAVARLPQGAVVLPGFDFDLNARSWTELQKGAQAADHPQFGFAQLCDRMGLEPRSIGRWSDVAAVSPKRNRIVSLAMRPAPVTDEWLEEGPEHTDALSEAMGAVDLMRAPSERIEAAAIAIALREAVARDQRAALITPDATLSRRVASELARWDIIPDDSAGVPLRVTPPAILADILMRAAGPRTKTAVFLSVLTHPLCAAGWDRAAHLRLTRALDAEVLRDLGPYVDWSALETWSASKEGGASWLAWLRAVFEGLNGPSEGSLARFATTHRTAMGLAVTGPEDGSDEALWDKEQGAALRKVFESIEAESDAAGVISRVDYGAILTSLIGAETIREPGFAPDKRVAIWGQLEARVQNADLIILGGLNEGTWPDLPAPDPWLSRPMRAELGLQVPERRVGLSAHDFQQAISNARVILSRSEKQDNTPTVPSRWLVRLENLMSGMGDAGKDALEAMAERGRRYVDLARAIDQPAQAVARCQRPAPAPPRAARPGTVSITDVEKLVRDPFQIYARKVLGLRPLPALGRLPDARDRGTALHAALEAFVARIADGIPENAVEIFRDTAFDVLGEEVSWAPVRRLWHARLMRLAEAFVAGERMRRTRAVPHVREVRGIVDLPNFDRPIALVGQADRIDLAPDGSVAIYDYKSSVPSDKQAQLFSKQLQLEARMAMLGAFRDLPQARATHLELIGLSKPGETLQVDADPDAILKDWTDFLKVVAHFELTDHGYASRLRPLKNVDWGDYDHLARRGEWDDGAQAVVEVLK